MMTLTVGESMRSICISLREAEGRQTGVGTKRAMRS